MDCMEEGQVLIMAKEISVWVATAVAVAVGIVITGSAWCLWAMVFPVIVSLGNNDESEDEIPPIDKL